MAYLMLSLSPLIHGMVQIFLSSSSVALDCSTWRGEGDGDDVWNDEVAFDDDGEVDNVEVCWSSRTLTPWAVVHWISSPGTLHMLSSVKPVSGSLTGQHMNTQKMLKASWSVVQDNRGRFCWRAHSDKLSCVDFLRIDGSGRCNVGDSIVTVWLNGQRAESHWVLEGIVYADQVKEKGLENWEGAAEVMGHAGPTCHPLMLEHEIPHMINDVSSPDNTLLTYNKPLHVTTHGLIVVF